MLVAIKPFRMGKYEVTVEEFERFVGATRYRTSRMCRQLASKRWFENVPKEFGLAATTLLTGSKFEPATAIAGVDCQDRSLRGGSWHWRGFHGTSRSPTMITMIGGPEGFRVAEDIGAAQAADAKPSAFEIELAQAQKAERERRSVIPEIPRPAS